MGNSQPVNNQKNGKQDKKSSSCCQEHHGSRRQSTPGLQTKHKGKYRSFLKLKFGAFRKSNQKIPPKIQINGQESFSQENMAPEEGIFSSHSTPYIKKHNFSQSLSVDSNYFPELTINTASFETDDGITEIHDFKTSASTRRMQFLNSSGSLNVRSLDSGSGGGSTDVEFEMKPFSRTRSYSPLRYMKTTSQRSLAASDQFLTCEQRTSFNNSWKILKDRILQQYEGSFYLNFGILIFGKVFKKVPELLEVFHLPSIEEIHNLPEDHMVNRHAILFTSLIDLAVRNIDQLESELGPALIIYGQRHAHFKSKKYFSESNIRCLCAQVVCTVAEILLDDLDSNCVNAWIDVLRFMGHTLLCGFDNEK